MTRDNLSKRKMWMIKYVYFARSMSLSPTYSMSVVWQEICGGVVAELTNQPEIVDFESMAKLWIRDKTLKVENALTTIVIWCLWKTRNDMCFCAGQG
jgi:hypothetical protein